MLKGFEEITYDVSVTEKFKIIPHMVELLELSTKDNPIVNADFKLYVEAREEVNLGSARVRKCINYIRIMNLVTGVVATSKGYWKAETIEEVEDCIESLTQRIKAITGVRDALISQKKEVGKRRIPVNKTTGNFAKI